MTSEGIQLQLLIGSGPTTHAAPPAVVAALESASVQTQATGRAGFQLRFNARSREQADALLKTFGDGLDPRARVILSVRIGGQWAVVSDGIVTQHQLSVTNSGAASISLSGQDLTFLMDLDERVGTPMPMQGAKEQVMQILTRKQYSELGIKPQVEETPQDDKRDTKDMIPAQKGTDYGHILGLAQPIGFTFYLIPGKLPGTSIAYWGPPVIDKDPQPALTLGMGSFTNVESLAFTLTSHQNTTIVGTFLDDQKQPTTERVKPAPRVAPSLAARLLPPARTRLLVDHSKLPPGLVRDQVANQQAHDPGGVSGQGSLDPARYKGLLRPRALVTVRGAASAYNGLYIVTNVSTDLSRSGVRQSFGLSRDGLYPLANSVNE